MEAIIKGLALIFSAMTAAGFMPVLLTIAAGLLCVAVLLIWLV